MKSSLVTPNGIILSYVNMLYFFKVMCVFNASVIFDLEICVHILYYNFSKVERNYISDTFTGLYKNVYCLA